MAVLMPIDLAPHVDERAAGVAGVDGGVGLEEVVERALPERAALGADDARGHRLLRPNGEPIASTQSPTLTRSESPRRAAGYGPAALQAEHGEVGPPVDPDDLGLVLLAVVVTTSMSVARSTTWALVSAMPDGSTMTPEPRLRCCCSRSGHLAKEPAEELLAEELLDRGAAAAAAGHGVDVDHGGGHGLGHLRQAARRHGQRGGDDRAPGRPRSGPGAAAAGCESAAPAPQAPEPDSEAGRDQERNTRVVRRTEIMRTASAGSPASSWRSRSPSSVSLALQLGRGGHQHRLLGGHQVAHAVVDPVDDGPGLVVDGAGGVLAVLPRLAAAPSP